MPLKQQLTTAEHAALGSDAERGYYKQVGANYVLDVEGIDNITSVVSTMQAERTRANTLQSDLKKYDGVDVDRYRQLVSADQGQQLGKIVDKGQYDKAVETINAQHKAELDARDARLNAQAIDHSLTLALSQAGVIPERLNDALQIARPLVGVLDGAVGVLGADGKVDAALKLDKWTGETFKKDRAFLFQPNGNGGSGAQNGTSGQGGQGEKQVKTRAEFNQLSPADKIAFSNLVAESKAQITP